MSDTSITALTLADLRDKMRAGEIGSEEATRAYLAEIEARDSDIGSYLLVRGDDAIEDAREADKTASSKSGDKPELLGVPVALKDIFLTKGIRTTCASKILENYIPPYQGTPARKLLDEAGAVLLGKLNMDEFAMGSSNEYSAYKPCRNPWDLDRVPGGSSGGSAAATAARLCAGALGTDTGGSIRQPAGFCGIVGIKPTYGRVSRYGVIAFASSLDQVGPMARNVRDSAILLKAIAGFDPADSTSVNKPVPDYEQSLTGDIKGLRVGLPAEYSGDGLSPEVAKALEAAVEKMKELGAEIVPLQMPHTKYAVATYYIVAPAEASSNLARYDGIHYGLRIDDGKGLRPMYTASRTAGFGEEVKRRIMLGTYVLSAGYYDAYYLQAMKTRTLIRGDFEAAFEKCDVIVAPSAPTTAFKIGEKTADPLEMYLNDIFTIPVNMAGLPGLTLPCGFDSDGLPIGLQVIGRSFDEETVFRAAHAYEQACEWHKRSPVV